MKNCAREADRKERAAESAYRALVRDCAKEISPKFLEKIRETIADPQGKLFTESLAEGCAGGTIEQGGQVLEQAIVSHLRRREACGQSGEPAVVDALADALAGRRDSQLRAMTGHWMKKGGISAAPAINAAKDVLRKLSPVDLATQILRGVSECKPKRTESKVDLDEDLGGHNNR